MYWLAGLGALITLVWFWRWRFLVVTVAGTSMQPALKSGDRLLARRTRLDRVKVGQVAVLRRPPESLILAGAFADDHSGLLVKRIAAMPGDRVPAACQAFADGQLPEIVPPGCFVMLGDNLRRSYNSRLAGLISGDLLFGVAVRRIGS
jgi:signal peptidase I